MKKTILLMMLFNFACQKRNDKIIIFIQNSSIIYCLNTSLESDDIVLSKNICKSNNTNDFTKYIIPKTSDSINLTIDSINFSYKESFLKVKKYWFVNIVSFLEKDTIYHRDRRNWVKKDSFFFEVQIMQTDTLPIIH